MLTGSEERFRFGLTESGKMVLRGAVFVGLAALIVPAFGVLCALAAVLVLTLLIGFVVRPRVHLNGNLPGRISAGQTARLTYTLKNVGRRPVYGLSTRFAALPPTIEQVEGEHMIRRLGPGDTVEVTVAIRPTRRGHYRIKHPICQSVFPFDLFWFGASREGEDNLVVLPPLFRLRMPLQHSSRCMSTGGTRLAGHVGIYPEYTGSRPFLPGDSPRRIDARAWARLAAPATKEYDEDCDNHAALVLDTHVPEALGRSSSKQIPELEAAISLCASVAVTINEGYYIDLLLAGSDLHHFTAWSRAERLDEIHDILADVEPSRNEPRERTVLSLADRLGEMSHIVFILLRWDKMRRQWLELADRAGCHSTVILVSQSDNVRLEDDIGTNWTRTVQVLSPDGILSGQVVQL